MSREQLGRTLASALIILHLCAIVIWCMPPGATLLRDLLLPVVRPYLILTGTWQNWEMFCPEPQNGNEQLNAEIVYQGDSVQVWPFPGTEDKPVLRRYFWERERKFRSNLVDENVNLYPGLCRYLARRLASPGHVPKTIRLVRYREGVLPPQPGDYQPLDRVDTSVTRTLLYEYTVQPGDLLMTLKAVAAAWNRFFFTPVQPTTIALYRIVYGITLLVDALILAPDLFYLMSNHGAFPLDSYYATQSAWYEFNPIAWLPQTDTWLIAFYTVYLIAIVMLTIGCFTRASSIVTYLCLLALHNRCWCMQNSGDNLMRIAGLFLIFSAAGAALSVDARRRGTPAEPAPCWPQRVLQLQLAFAYFVTAWSKSTNWKWVGGIATYYTSRLWEYARFPVPYVFEHLWTIKLVTIGVLLLEFSLALLVWVDDLRPWILIGGVLLHLGLEYSMNLPVMEWVFLGLYILWIPPSTVEGWLRRLFSASG